MALTTGKIASVMFEKAIETYEQQMQMLDLVSTFNPSSGDMQNSGNVIWRPVQQHAPIIDGWDLTGSETGVIEETYPAVLGTPKNDFVELRADNLRDPRAWERRGETSGRRQATELNSAIGALIANTGSLYYRTNATSGYNAIAIAQAMLNERQKGKDDDRFVVLNDRDTLTYASDLAGRQTLQGQPDKTWKTGQIGSNVAGFDIYTGSFLPTLAAETSATDTTTDADVEGAPEAGSVDATTYVVTNVDYRVGTIPVTATTNYSVGDTITFTNSGTAVQSVGLADKNPTGQAMTFRVIKVNAGVSLEVYPKPIAVGDSALSTEQEAYANINTQILSGAAVLKVNETAGKANIFGCKSSIEVLGGDAPLELLNELGGMKVVTSTMSNGQKMYMAYDGDIAKLTFRCRLFTWYGVTNADPSANGAFITY